MSMNVEHKKTALDDSASIYSRNRDSANKENIKNLSKTQKLRYFKDYYGVMTIVIIAVVIGVCSLIYQTVINPSKSVLSVACVNNVSIYDREALSNTLKDYLGGEDSNDFASVSYYSLDDPNMNMTFMTHAMTGSIDIIICDEEYFVEAANQGMLADLSEILPDTMKEALSADFIESEIAQKDADGNVTGYEESAPYGLSITDSEVFAEYGGYGENPILCVHVNAPSMENTLKTIAYFTGTEY